MGGLGLQRREHRAYAIRRLVGEPGGQDGRIAMVIFDAAFSDRPADYCASCFSVSWSSGTEGALFSRNFDFAMDDTSSFTVADTSQDLPPCGVYRDIDATLTPRRTMRTPKIRFTVC